MNSPVNKLTTLTPVAIDGVNYYLATEAMPLAPVYFKPVYSGKNPKPWDLTKDDCKLTHVGESS